MCSMFDWHDKNTTSESIRTEEDMVRTGEERDWCRVLWHKIIFSELFTYEFETRCKNRLWRREIERGSGRKEETQRERERGCHLFSLITAKQTDSTIDNNIKFAWNLIRATSEPINDPQTHLVTYSPVQLIGQSATYTSSLWQLINAIGFWQAQNVINWTYASRSGNCSSFGGIESNFHLSGFSRTK